MSDPTSTMYFHIVPCDLSIKILFEPKEGGKPGAFYQCFQE